MLNSPYRYKEIQQLKRDDSYGKLNKAYAEGTLHQSSS